jgi:hypothetical protein
VFILQSWFCCNERDCGSAAARGITVSYSSPATDPNTRRRPLPANDRIDPTTSMGITLDLPDVRAREHAKARVLQQMRYFCLLYLLRVKGAVPQGTVSQAATQFQYGRGGAGEQAAHKIISSFRVNGKDLLDFLDKTSGLYRYMVGLLAETTILPKAYNEADDYMEQNGLRNGILSLGQKIVQRSYQNVNLATDYPASMLSLYQLFRMEYLNLCSSLTVSSLGGAKDRGEKFGKQEVALSKAKGPAVAKIEKQISLGMLHQQGEILMGAVLHNYQQVVRELTTPLSVAELQGMRKLAGI